VDCKELDDRFAKVIFGVFLDVKIACGKREENQSDQSNRKGAPLVRLRPTFSVGNISEGNTND